MCWWTSPMTRDHPRGCGEHTAVAMALHASQGSSPRMRGAPGTTSANRRKTRIIPADAGSTTPCSPPSPAREDHPRGCGEHQVTISVLLFGQGSSPRMRGARTQTCHLAPDPGIIPADAGSTLLPFTPRQTRKDHPRGCGEHVLCSSLILAFAGSSPRMRGAPTLFDCYSSPIGIIPADAGSTTWECRIPDSRWDHPRGCGEHKPSFLTDINPAGSSPRMRGALRPVHRQRPEQRTDHPRGCGEHLPDQPSRGDWIGSSPRMRGAPGFSGKSFSLSRIIPADAGSTSRKKTARP